MATNMNWTAACLQVFTTVLRDIKTRDEAMHLVATKLDHVERLVAEATADGKVRLLLLPEFFLSGSPQGATTEQWMERACLDIDGPEIDRIQGWASRHKVFIGANAYCTSALFPGRFLNTSFLISPSGDIILKAYRIHTGIAASPHDFLKEFLDKVGIDGLFPVVKTELGHLAMVTSTDLAWPEVPRAHILRGAEVLLHPASESPLQKEILEPVRRARAVENMAYVVSCNTAGSAFAGTYGTAAADQPPATSKIFDLDGKIIAAASEGEAINCRAEIDLAAVRKRRANPSGLNYLAGLRVETFTEVYAKTSIYPPNTWSTGTLNYIAQTPAHLQQAVARMKAQGMLPEA